VPQRSDDDVRLPRNLVARHYDIEWDLDLDGARFDCATTVHLDVVTTTDVVVLNALGLTVSEAEVVIDAGGAAPQRVEVLATDTDGDRERVALRLAEHLPADRPVSVRLRCAGDLGDDLVGLYRSTWSRDGVDHTLAVTQFESTHARRAFPCLDEPDRKATFDIAAVVDEGVTVVSNAAEIAREPAGAGRVRVRFATTMPMSTYLVALVAGPLECTEPVLVERADGGPPIPLRVVHPPGMGHLTGFALDVAAAGLRWFERYYGIGYPGDKVDLIAVPDFAFGAMENLGCITFREVLLLVDPAAATRPELQRVADVINHELAHMWFGDLVTMSWWNGIWLNEAFATFMEVSATDAFRPDWNVWTTFGLARAEAFDTDALASTRPIEYEVLTPADAEGMFDVLTYEKGASVVRMIERYLGPEAFRAGVGAYLRRHAHGNTETADLWDALEEVTGEPVRRVMDAWILRGGHPVVGVEPTGRGVRISQRPMGYGAAVEGVRPVPLVLTTTRAAGTTTTHRLVLEEPVELDLGGPAEVVQPNTGGDGFFRSELDATSRTALLGSGPTPLERFVLLDDTWALSLAGRVPAAELVDLVVAMAAGEREPDVWRRLAGVLRELRRLVGEDHVTRVAELIRRVTGRPLGDVGARLDGAAPGPERDRDEALRGILVSVTGTAGEDRAVAELAPRLLDDRSADASLRAAALDVVASRARGEVFADLERRWRAATTPQDEVRHLYALADTDDADCFERTLHLALGEVRTQNAPFLLGRAIANQRLGGDAWQFLEAHWSEAVDRFPSSSLPRMLGGIRGVTDLDLAARIGQFLDAHPLAAGELVIAQHRERMGVTVAAATRLRAELDGGAAW
jgi:puromycin-sensitive aminopeptidase